MIGIAAEKLTQKFVRNAADFRDTNLGTFKLNVPNCRRTIDP